MIESFSLYIAHLVHFLSNVGLQLTLTGDLIKLYHISKCKPYLTSQSCKIVRLKFTF